MVIAVKMIAIRTFFKPHIQDAKRTSPTTCSVQLTALLTVMTIIIAVKMMAIRT